MEAILKFKMSGEDHDRYQFNQATHAAQYMSAIHDIVSFLRSEHKHGDPDKKWKTPYDTVDAIYERVWQILGEHKIDPWSD